MAEGAGPPPDVGGWVAWIGGVLALVGGPAAIRGIANWIVDRRDKARATRADGNREWEAKLKERERELDRRLDETLAGCEAHCKVLADQVDKLKMAVMLLLPEVTRHAPTSPIIAEVGELLAGVVPIKFTTPPDMQRLLDKIP